MKIAFTQNVPHLWSRIKFFYNHLVNEGHEVIFHNDLTISPNTDVWFFDYYVLNTNFGMTERANSYEKLLLDYKGKLLFYVLDDGGATFVRTLLPSLLDRVDGWVSLTSRLPSHQDFYHPTMEKKQILFPRYLVDYRPLPTIPKINQCIFMGTTTGAMRFNGKNWRVEGVRRLKEHSVISKSFIGGLIENHVIDVTSLNQEMLAEYNKSFQHLVVPRKPILKWYELIDQSQIYISFPGHTRWSYRQPEAMRSKCTILSMKLVNVPDPGNWMFRDVFKDEFYWIDDDMSNLEELCEYALTHENESKDKAEEGYQLYKKYFELTPLGCCGGLLRDELCNQFSKIGITI